MMRVRRLFLLHVVGTAVHGFCSVRASSRVVSPQLSSVKPALCPPKTVKSPVPPQSYDTPHAEKDTSALLEPAEEQVIIQQDDRLMNAAIFNLIKCAMGSGVLALPSGIAAMSDVKSALLPASLFLTALGAVSAYTFYNVGCVCQQTGAKSMGEAWELQFGKGSTWIVSFATASLCFGICLAYSIVVGDTFHSLATTTKLPLSRLASHMLVTLGAMLPLSMLDSLGALAPVSAVGVIGTFLTVVFMGWRCLGPVYKPGGSLFATLSPALKPSFGVRGPGKALSSLVLVSMSALAFLIHFAAADFVYTFPKGEKRLKSFKSLTVKGFSWTVALSVSILAFGYLTFGGNSAGNILNNYASVDVGATICRLLMGISVVGSFPFPLFSCRSALLDLIGGSGSSKDATPRTNRIVSGGLLAVVTSLALKLKDAGLVVAINGAIMGSALNYIFPAIMFLKSGNGGRWERRMNRSLIVVGIAMAITGGAVSCLNAFAPHLLR